MSDQVEKRQSLTALCFQKDTIDKDVKCKCYSLLASIDRITTTITVIPRPCTGCLMEKNNMPHEIIIKEGRVTECKEASPFAQAAVKLAQSQNLIP